MPTTEAKLRDMRRQGFEPMCVRLTQLVPGPVAAFEVGEVVDVRTVANFAVKTVRGNVPLNPDEFDVLLWRWWPPLPCDDRRHAAQTHENGHS